ncbi:MAG TPA: DUF5658 family protein [Vicinamibacterales bacterium]|nr:DUF5658 family protein [Vicinamibacterales bacterium]
MASISGQEAGNLPTLRNWGVKVGTGGSTGRDIFGDVALLVFLIAQASDGVLTYVGVSTYGLHIEANPLIGWLMALLGEGAALATAKGAAVAFGIALHLSAVHRAVAALAVLYLAVAVFPWVAILYYY